LHPINLLYLVLLELTCLAYLLITADLSKLLMGRGGGHLLMVRNLLDNMVELRQILGLLKLLLGAIVLIWLIAASVVDIHALAPLVILKSTIDPLFLLETVFLVT
jgi:hypothetical protein